MLERLAKLVRRVWWLDWLGKSIEAYTSLIQQYPLIDVILRLGIAAMAFAWTYFQQSWLPMALIAAGFAYVLLRQLPGPLRVEQEAKRGLPTEETDKVFFRAAVSQSPPIGTHPADVENKLKAIVQTLAFIRDQAPIAKLMKELILTWTHVARSGDRTEFAQKVESVEKMLISFYQNNMGQGQRVREYDHVGDVISAVPHRDDLEFLTTRFAEAMRQTDNVLLLESPAKDWREWMNRWCAWREDAENRLIQLKR